MIYDTLRKNCYRLVPICSAKGVAGTWLTVESYQARVFAVLITKGATYRRKWKMGGIVTWMHAMTTTDMFDLWYILLSCAFADDVMSKACSFPNSTLGGAVRDRRAGWSWRSSLRWERNKNIHYYFRRRFRLIFLGFALFRHFVLLFDVIISKTKYLSLFVDES